MQNAQGESIAVRHRPLLTAPRLRNSLHNALPNKAVHLRTEPLADQPDEGCVFGIQSTPLDHGKGEIVRCQRLGCVPRASRTKRWFAPLAAANGAAGALGLIREISRAGSNRRMQWSTCSRSAVSSASRLCSASICPDISRRFSRSPATVFGLCMNRGYENSARRRNRALGVFATYYRSVLIGWPGGGVGWRCQFTKQNSAG